MSNTTEPLDTSTLLAHIKSRLQAVYGDRLRGVVLYGSEARGEATPDSDVDILVLLTGPVALGRELLRSSRRSTLCNWKWIVSLRHFPWMRQIISGESMPGIAMRRKRASSYEQRPGPPRLRGKIRQTV